MNTAFAVLVWERARDCCEYCRMPQVYDELRFELDHIFAEQHGGKTVAGNLAPGIDQNAVREHPDREAADPRIARS